MIGRMEVREILGMLGTLAALSLAGTAVQSIGAEMVEVRDAPAEAVEAPAAVRVAPPVLEPGAEPGLRTEEVRLERPEVAPPPLRCPPLPDVRLREWLPSCRPVLA